MHTTSNRRQKELDRCSNWPGDGIFAKFLAEAVAAQETADRAEDAPVKPQGSPLIPNQNYRYPRKGGEMDCLILGDSIAAGLHRQMPQCESFSRGGWNSSQWNRDYLKNDLTAKTVIISLGSNDSKSIKTKAELSILREKVNGQVFWILPAIKPHIQADVREIAALYGDTVIPIAHAYDGVHPSREGYKQIATRVRREK
jgi:hypothetical protein